MKEYNVKRDFYGRIQGFTVDDPSKTISDPDGKLFEAGCEIIGNSFIGKMFKLYFTIIKVLFILLVGVFSLLVVIQYVTEVEIIDYIVEFFNKNFF